jgi:hypothetical protein
VAQKFEQLLVGSLPMILSLGTIFVGVDKLREGIKKSMDSLRERILDFFAKLLKPLKDHVKGWLARLGGESGGPRKLSL